MMRYMTIVNERGEPRRKPMRNADRCANLADARGKFRAEMGNEIADAHGYWKSLAVWSFKEVDE